MIFKDPIFSSDFIKNIEEAIKDKVTLAVEAALTSQDELYSDKIQELVEAIDKDHSSKLMLKLMVLMR